MKEGDVEETGHVGLLSQRDHMRIAAPPNRNVDLSVFLASQFGSSGDNDKQITDSAKVFYDSTKSDCDFLGNTKKKEEDERHQQRAARGGTRPGSRGNKKNKGGEGVADTLNPGLSYNDFSIAV